MLGIIQVLVIALFVAVGVESRWIHSQPSDNQTVWSTSPSRNVTRASTIYNGNGNWTVTTGRNVNPQLNWGLKIPKENGTLVTTSTFNSTWLPTRGQFSHRNPSFNATTWAPSTRNLSTPSFPSFNNLNLPHQRGNFSSPTYQSFN